MFLFCNWSFRAWHILALQICISSRLIAMDKRLWTQNCCFSVFHILHMNVQSCLILKPGKSISFIFGSKVQILCTPSLGRPLLEATVQCLREKLSCHSPLRLSVWRFLLLHLYPTLSPRKGSLQVNSLPFASSQHPYEVG